MLRGLEWRALALVSTMNNLGYQSNTILTTNSNWGGTQYYPAGYYTTLPQQIQSQPIQFYSYQKQEEKEVSAQKTLSSAVNAGVQVIYRYGKNPVQTQIMRGVLDTDIAEEMFLEQFSEEDEKPEVVASISVLVAA